MPVPERYTCEPVSSLVLAVAVALVGVEQPAPPSVGEGIALSWASPPDCPGTQAVRNAIDQNLASVALDDAWREVSVVGAIDREGEVWSLRVDVVLPDETITRQVRGATCDELTAAAGLLIAVALDPLRTAKTRTSALAGDLPPEPRPELAAVDPSPPTIGPARVVASPPSARTRWRVELRGAGLFEAGTLPRVRGGAWLAIGLVARRARIDLAGWVLAPRDMPPLVGGEGVRLLSGAATLRGCATPRLGAIVLGTCGGVEIGGATGRGVGVALWRRTAAPTAAITLGPELAWRPRGRVGLWIGADALVHLIRPRWTIRGRGTAVATSPAGFRVMVGPSVRL